MNDCEFAIYICTMVWSMVIIAYLIHLRYKIKELKELIEKLKGE